MNFCSNIFPHAGKIRLRLHSFSVFVTLIGLTLHGAHAQTAAVTLNEALHLSLQRSSIPQAALASVTAGREAAAKAGQLPDPMFKLGIDNVPVNGEERWSTTRDFMTMRRVGIEQQWTSSDKRTARSERALRAVEVAEGTYLAKVARLREEAAKAWVRVLYAQRSHALVKTLAEQSADDLAAIQAGHRAAKSTASEVLQAQLNLSQARDAVSKSEQELRNALLALTRWTTTAVDSVADEAPPLTSRVQTLSVEELEQIHPAVLAARRGITLADADITVARRERRPDWSFEANFNQRPQFSNMISVGVSIPLPVNPAQRQDRDIAERSAMGTQARLEYEDAVREAQTDIQTQAAMLANFKNRLDHLRNEALPVARQQSELAIAAYRSGTGSLSNVYSARKMLTELQLQLTDLEKEAATTWASLEHRVLPAELVSTAKEAP